jgi:hypothetical protein
MMMPVHGVNHRDWSPILEMTASFSSCGSVAGLTLFYRVSG